MSTKSGSSYLVPKATTVERRAQLERAAKSARRTSSPSSETIPTSCGASTTTTRHLWDQRSFARKLSGDQCTCEAGYMVDPNDALSCVEIPSCGDHGHWDVGECVCDAGYMVDPNDALSCVEIPECAGHGQLDGDFCVCEAGYAVDPDDGTTCVEDGSVHQDSVAVDLELHLHANDVKIDLYTMEVLGEEETEYDLFLGHDDPVDNGPNMHLGPGVTAQSLNASQIYHAVTEAPVDGYLSDDPGANDYVIGSSWRDGGDGTVGFHMTETVYAVKLANGTYAKIEILSAQGGTVHVLCYLQPDGSRDLTTTAP